MQRFFDFASALGILVRGTKGTITPKDLQHVIEGVEDKPEAAVINTMLLRSMQQARYSEDNFGHYGLAADYYTHFYISYSTLSRSNRPSSDPFLQ